MAGMPDENWALLPAEEQRAEIRINQQEAEITNGRITAKISARAEKYFFYNQLGKLILREQWRTRNPGFDKISALEIPGREFRPNIGGGFQVICPL
jgi:alpha-D-xyloside xylohydrolase